MRANRDGPAQLAELCAARRHAADPHLDRLRVRRAQGRALCRNRPDQADRRLWRHQARRRAGGAGGLPARDRAAHLLGVCGDRQEFRAHHAECWRRPATSCGWSPTSSAARPRRRTSPARSSTSWRGWMTAGGTSMPACSTPPAAAWTTWHGLAEAVFDAAARHGGPRPVVEAISTADYPTPAPRPADSRLDCGKLARTFGVRLPDWRGSLARTVGGVIGARRRANLTCGRSNRYPRRDPALHLQRRALSSGAAGEPRGADHAGLAALLAR